MNAWMKRGLETASLTGGLIGPWTGVASADDRTGDVAARVTVCGTSSPARQRDAVSLASGGRIGGLGHFGGWPGAYRHPPVPRLATTDREVVR